MPTPLEIAFVDAPPSIAIETDVRQRVAKLERLSNAITSCHVYIAAPHQHQRSGNAYEIRVELRLSGGDPLVVSNKPGDINAHGDPHIAVRDAFDAMERQLRDLKRR